MFSENKKSIQIIIEDAPKTLHKEYLQSLNMSLGYNDLESKIYIDDIVSSLLLLVIDSEAPISRRHLAIVMLQKLSPIRDISEIINIDVGYRLIFSFPVLLSQNIDDFGTKSVIRKLAGCLCSENWPAEYQCKLLSFLSKVVISSKSPLTQGEMKKITSLLSEWLITSTSLPIANKQPGFRRSASSLSIIEIDGSTSQDFFTVLNYASSINAEFLRSIQVFSMLRAYLNASNDVEGRGSRQKLSEIGNYGSEELSISVKEYCMRIIDQVDRRAASDNVAHFQKACLVEVIHLFNILCLMDSGIVHTIFPVVRRIYDSMSTSKDLEAQDVAVMASSMQYFMNHGSSVMHKPDSLYVNLFCDLLTTYYKDNYISFEILQLMQLNLSQLCYHSSILEKYFPTFFKVLAWRPTTFIDNFLELLPAFLCQNTSIEVFHTILDLPCLTAILMLTDSKTSGSESWLKDSGLMEELKNSDVTAAIKLMLRKTSGYSDIHKSAAVLHQSLAPLASKGRIVYCSEIVIPLLKRYFEVLSQYADITVASFLITAILERLSSIFPVPGYAKEIHKVLSDAVVKLFELHPEIVFHSKKPIISYISHLKNYYTAEQNFIHMVWAIGEFVSVAHSETCRPEVIALFFENLESTTYEAVSSLHKDSNENFLKLLIVSLTTLSKLAARNQDQVPRAVLCLTKVQQNLVMFGNEYKETWKIVNSRISELLSILNSPSVASIVLSPPKNLENGRLHRDSTSLPYILKAITGVLSQHS